MCNHHDAATLLRTRGIAMTFAGMLSIFGLQLHVASGSARAEPLNDFDWHKPCISTTSAARVDNGDGTWSFELDPQFDVSVVLTSRAIEWVYDRQQRFPYEPIDPSGPVIVTGSSIGLHLGRLLSFADPFARVCRMSR